jgi:hypothetical protein
MNRSVTMKVRGGGCSVWVLNRGKEGRKGKCLSSTGRADKAVQMAKMGLMVVKHFSWTGSPETSVSKCQTTLRHFPKQ